MISSNSFCGFIFARAIDMNLDPPFFYNPLGKNGENNLIYFLETVTQGSEMISPNSFCGFISTRAIDMNLDPPFLYSRLNKNDRKKNIITLKLCSFAEGSEIISANSFCGFTFARAIDMNLDPPFLCNRSGKNDS